MAKIPQPLQIIGALIAVGILFAGVVAMYGYAMASLLATTESSFYKKIADPSCTGEDHPYYDLGYGTMHPYNGQIVPGQEVNVLLSCDHTKLFLSGAVHQTISGDDGLGELADLVAGTEVVDLNTDYNDDGYNDLTSIAINGQGQNQVDTFYIWTFDPGTNQFVLNNILSDLNGR